MKCENCGKNEVTFVYKSNINGHVEEKHLCGECAQALGYTQRMAAGSKSMLQSFFGENSPFSDPFFTEPFGTLLGSGDLFSGRPRLGWMLEDPFDDFFAEMPVLSAAPEQREEQKQPEAARTEGENHPSRFARLRERNALKMEMKQAIRQENFERAAELRDQLRQMEQSEHQKDQASQ